MVWILWVDWWMARLPLFPESPLEVLLLAVFPVDLHVKSVTELAEIEAHKRLAARGETFGWPLPPDYAKVNVVESNE